MEILKDLLHLDMANCSKIYAQTNIIIEFDFTEMRHAKHLHFVKLHKFP